mmetsp:Transcript_11482/g.31308  ORF Transcript_11482/g.31308 Transcript_11482/m.31308 type:complete len:543 (+) Transcript_11482:946-2574(+)
MASGAGSSNILLQQQEQHSSEVGGAAAPAVAQQHQQQEQHQQQQEQQQPQSLPSGSRTAAAVPPSSLRADGSITFTAAALASVQGTASELAARLTSRSPSSPSPSATTATTTSSGREPQNGASADSAAAHIPATPSSVRANGQAIPTPAQPVVQAAEPGAQAQSTQIQGEVLPPGGMPPPQPQAQAPHPSQAQAAEPVPVQGEVAPMPLVEGHAHADHAREGSSDAGGRSSAPLAWENAAWTQQQQIEQGLGRSHGADDLGSSSSSGSSHGGDERGRSRRRGFGLDPTFGQRDVGEPSTSYDHEGSAPSVRPRSPGSRHRFPKHTFTPNNSKTGSAVAATCLRMKVFANFNPTEGFIDLTPTEIVKWVRARHIWQLRMRGMLGVSGAPQGAVAQSSFSARDEVTAPSIDEADFSDSPFVGADALQPRLGGGGRSLAQRRPFVVPPPGAKQSMRGGMRGVDAGSSQGIGRPAGGRGPFRSSDDSDDSDAERNDFGAWSPVPRKSGPASRLQQQQRDIRLGLAPQVRRPQAVSADRPQKESDAS